MDVHTGDDSNGDCTHSPFKSSIPGMQFAATDGQAPLTGQPEDFFLMSPTNSILSSPSKYSYRPPRGLAPLLSLALDLRVELTACHVCPSVLCVGDTDNCHNLDGMRAPCLLSPTTGAQMFSPDQLGESGASDFLFH